MCVTRRSVSINNWQARLTRTRLTKSVKVLPVARRKKREKRVSLMPSSAAASAADNGFAKSPVMRSTMTLICSSPVSSSSPCICTLDSSR